MRCFQILCALVLSTASFFANPDLPSDFLTKEFHKGRREKLREKLPANSVAVFLQAPCATVPMM